MTIFAKKRKSFILDTSLKTTHCLTKYWYRQDNGLTMGGVKRKLFEFFQWVGRFCCRLTYQQRAQNFNKKYKNSFELSNFNFKLEVKNVTYKVPLPAIMLWFIYFVGGTPRLVPIKSNKIPTKSEIDQIRSIKVRAFLGLHQRKSFRLVYS